MTILLASLLFLALFNKTRYSKYFSLRHFTITYTLPVIILAGLITRYIIVSGWLVYPFPFGNLHLDWSVSTSHVIGQLASIKSWARIPYGNPSEVLNNGFFHWFNPWFFNFRKNVTAMSLLCAGLVGLVYWAFGKSTRIFRNIRSVPLLLSILTTIVGLMYWFVIAPDLRFGQVFFWLFAAVSLVPIIYLLLTWNARTRNALTVLFCSFFLYVITNNFASNISFVTSHLFHLPASESKDVDPIYINNGQEPPLIIYRPSGYSLCGNSLLPCSPYISENSKIELRVPGKIESGFRQKERLGVIDVTGIYNPYLILIANFIANTYSRDFRVEGMREPEGPYPKWNLPRVRWINDSVARISFENVYHLERMKLHVTFRPQIRPTAKMNILFNNKALKTYTLTGAENWENDIFYLSPKEGLNVIEFVNEPINGEPPPPDSLYMLFRALSLQNL